MTAQQARGASGYVIRDGVKLHHLDYGAGDPAIVVIPGITSPAITWEFAAEDLADEHRVIVLDMRGRGLSDKPASGFTLEDYAADVLAVIDGVGLRRPVVLGHSMGARIAAAVAVAAPAKAGPVLMLDPPLTRPGSDPYPTPLKAFMDQLEAARRGATVEDMRPFFPSWTDEQLQLRADWLGTCDEEAVRESWHNFHREDFFPYLKQVRPPALFMYGGDSPVVTADAIPEVRETNAEVELVCIPGAGHMIPWDNFADFRAETARFLASA